MFNFDARVDAPDCGIPLYINLQPVSGEAIERVIVQEQRA